MKKLKVFLAFAAAVIVTVGCFAANIGGAWMGGRADWSNFAATVVYILFWGGLTWFLGKDPALFRLPLVFSFLTFISSALSLRAHIADTGGFIDAFLSVLASVPLYGLLIFVDWRGLYLAATALSLLWTLYCLAIRRRPGKTRII